MHYRFPSLDTYLTYWPRSWQAIARTELCWATLNNRASCLRMPKPSVRSLYPLPPLFFHKTYFSNWWSWSFNLSAFSRQKFSDWCGGDHSSLPVSTSDAYTSKVLNQKSVSVQGIPPLFFTYVRLWKFSCSCSWMKTISSISSWSDHFRVARCCTKERRSATSMAAKLFFGARSMRFCDRKVRCHPPFFIDALLPWR